MIVKLEKGKIYKATFSCKCFNRNYILFSPSDSECLNTRQVISIKTLFLINLNGLLTVNRNIGFEEAIRIDDVLTVSDWFEIGQAIKGSSIKINLKTKRVIKLWY